MRLPHRLPATPWAVVVLGVADLAPRGRSCCAVCAVPASPAGGTDAQRCAALAAMDFGSLPDAPTRTRSRELSTCPSWIPRLLRHAVEVLASSPIKQGPPGARVCGAPEQVRAPPATAISMEPAIPP